MVFFQFFHKGVQIRSRHRYEGGAKILTFQQNHNTTIALSVPEGAKLHCQFRWGAMAEFAPPRSATDDPFFKRKTTISQKNSYFLLSSSFRAHPTTLLLKILGDQCMGRPPTLNFWGDRPPSPPSSPPLVQLNKLYSYSL